MLHTKRARVPKVYPLVAPIDETETIKQLGYSATTASPGGDKKVVFRCATCARLVTRARRNVRAPFECHSCATTKKDVHEPLGLIDEEATKLKWGYIPTEIPRHSLKHVVGICATCSSRYDLRIKTSKEGHQCRACFKRDYWDKRIPPRKKDGQALLHETETQRIYGYPADSVTPKSLKRVAVTCPCGTVYTRMRNQVHDASVCRGCTRKKIDHEKLQEKRKETIRKNGGLDWKEINDKRQQTNLVRYPEGIPTPKGYGNVVDGIVKQLETNLKRKLVREKSLTNGQRLDIFDEETKVGIEYCGLYWHHEHSPTPRSRNYHRDKMRLAQEEGYTVITVFEDEYLEHPNATISRLTVILGQPRRMVYARKCALTVENNDTARKFLNNYHIQGSPSSFSYSIGMRHEGELIALITGGKHHRQGHDSSVVLSRLCFSPAAHIVGGSERLYKELCRCASADGYLKIITWSDNRWTEGAVYSRIGMFRESELPPDYSYVNIKAPRKRVSKQSQKKSNTGCPQDVTERDWAFQHGLSRIWDCGKVRWSVDL